MNKHLLGQVSEEVCYDLLILNEPGIMGRVGNYLFLTIFIFASDCFGRLLDSLIYIAKQASSQYLGSCLGSPENVVRPAKRF